MGNEKVAGKVVSDCGTCHGFHMAPHETPAPTAKRESAQLAVKP
jgi:hypothetical protein